ncbi:hypothetical protein POV27_06305 [Aureisphaera galaxeae]|uniref:hypothetical protein n=1 Tax=Aureisphaera galaxeae TaxID=1538023 RepID=UPI00234FC22B|nr:hypothetical protein [Aureisphaera galaxeae]MDC8003656.1 hypothetical protein [Aureisphaera galaxeae]
MKNKIIKVATLTLFSSLIIGFVAFQSGYFGGKKSSVSGSPNGSTLINQADTIQKVDSIKWKKSFLISSSKSFVIHDPLKGLEDSTKLDSSLQIDPLIYSSKSGIIVTPEDLKKMVKDSLEQDSIKRK